MFRAAGSAIEALRDGQITPISTAKITALTVRRLLAVPGY